jgi:hypothetical protein
VRLLSATAKRRHLREERVVHDKLSPVHLLRAIRIICHALSFEVVKPTIDCFANSQNVQDIVTMYVTACDDFFSVHLDCARFWELNVAWAHPPHIPSTLEQTVRVFARRRIRGYICGPQWPIGLDINNADKNEWLYLARRSLGYKGEHNLGGRGKTNLYFPLYTGCNAPATEPCPFNTVVIYFDFRQCV